MSITFLKPPAASSIRAQYRHDLRLMKTHTHERLIKVAGRSLLVELTLTLSDFRRPPARIQEFPARPSNEIAPSSGAAAPELTIPTPEKTLTIEQQKLAASERKTELLTLLKRAEGATSSEILKIMGRRCPPGGLRPFLRSLRRDGERLTVQRNALGHSSYRLVARARPAQ